MTIEGLKEYEALRDFLYSRMRGVKDHAHHPAPAAPDGPLATGTGGHAELAAALRETAAELRAVREALAKRTGS
jgi:putative membrane protein